MKYVKLPVEIEAIVIVHHESMDTQDIPRWLIEAAMEGKIIDSPCGGMLIKTTEGDMIGRVGDYLIKGVEGELYPCSPSVFKATYRLA